MSVIKFLAYNNAVPITLGVLFLSSGLVFAANEEAREFVVDSVYQAETKVVSIDNSYIANTNLDVYSPKVSINSVTEDDEFYYVSYTFITISLVDGVWQDVAQQKIINVRKTALGQYKDLGVYVTEQLKQLVDRELTYLKEVQDIEKRLVTSKVVATAYSGLVGQLIDDTTEELPGYTPLVNEPVVQNVDPVAIAKAEKSDVVTPPPPTSDTSQNSTDTGTSDQQNNSGPVVTVLGANPARIPVGSAYSDLGAVSTTAEGVTLDLTIKLTLNSTEVSSIDIDTSVVGDWSVGYTVTDQDDNTGFAERVVVVYDPNASEEPTEETATTTETATATTTETITATTIDPVEETPTSDPVATTTEQTQEETTQDTPDEVEGESVSTSTSEQAVDPEPAPTPTTEEEVVSATSTETQE